MKNEREALRELISICEQVIKKKVLMDSFSRDYGIPLYMKEILTIRVVGKNPGINMTGVAERMGVTRGAVSQTVAKLVRKKLIRKTYSEDNAKEIILQLTDFGWTVFNTREKVIDDFLSMAQVSLGDDFMPQLAMLISVMTTINKLLGKYVASIKGN